MVEVVQKMVRLTMRGVSLNVHLVRLVLIILVLHHRVLLLVLMVFHQKRLETVFEVVWQ